VSDLPVGSTLNFDIYDTRGQLLIARNTPLTEQIIKGLQRRNITVVYMGPPDDPSQTALAREAAIFKGRPDRQFYLALGQSNITANVSVIAKEMALESLKKAFYVLGPESAIDLDDVQDTCDELIEDLVGDEVTTLSIIDMYLVNPSLYHHSINVTAIFASVCKALNLPADRVKAYAAAAMLHDLGRVLLRKLARKNVPAQVDVDRLHTEAAYKYLKGLGGLEEGPLNAVRNHHERYDGRGYPRGVDYRELGDYGQVLILANYYDKMTWDESREMKTGFHQAANYIIQLSRKLVDAHIVTAFLNVFGHHPPGSWVELSSGEVGMVVQANPFKPRRPVVHIFYDNEGSSLDEVISVDLSIPGMPVLVGPFRPINGFRAPTAQPEATPL
jgi:HD-GYP domain-containing protein (c-di-GMP phosphodiesterase class II)